VTFTLLIDLDDTLLVNPMDSFVPAYLQALSNHLAAYASPQEIIKNLLYATQQMSQAGKLDCTLKQIFDGIFYPALRWNQDEMRPVIDEFYTEVFPKLKKYTRPMPGAVELVEGALMRGARVVVATNPLFPYTAISQRLTWAGLSPQDYTFDLIPSYESFHFAKPNPAYLAECLARLGWPEGPILMVGDDPINDLQAAGGLGIYMYWVTDNQKDVASLRYQPAATGKMTDLLAWIDSLEQDRLQPNYNHPSAMLATLKSTPAVLDSICYQIDPQYWNQRPEVDEWCQTEILCHLRDVDADVNIPRIEKVLSEQNPFIPGEDTNPWAHEREYICQNGEEALQAFVATRSKFLQKLSALDRIDWQRLVRHAIFGPTTLQEIVGIIAGHDRLHIRQLVQVTEDLSAAGE